MKNPVLHVKKDAERYDDPPAGSNLQPPRQGAQTGRTIARKSSRSPRRRRRFTFVPLVILAIMLVIVVRVVPRGPTNRATIMGWDTVLRAMPYEDMLLVSVTFIQAAPPGPNGPPAPRAVVRVVLPETGEQLSLSEDLSKSPMTLRGQMRPTHAVKKVLATVSVGKETRTLTLSARAAP
jgi:hypothetical protein